MNKHFNFVLVILVGITLFWGMVILSPQMPSNSLVAGFFGDLLDLFKTESVEEPIALPPPVVGDVELQSEEPPSLYQPVVDYENAVIAAVETAAPAVVSIAITKELPILEQCEYDPFDDQFLQSPFDDFFGGSPFRFYRQCQTGTEKREVGGGTGFIITQDGMIVTNKHVVSDTEAAYTVLTNDGKQYQANILARDPVQDLAIIQIKATELPTVVLGDSETIKLGQTAIAIGNALAEFRNTVSVGVISGLARDVVASAGRTTEHFEDLIQTDAAINRGNSGGPLLNLHGEVIGVNTATALGAQNIGFAIPINKVKRDIASVKESGKISAPFLGVRYMTITEVLQSREELPVSYGALLRGHDEGPAIVPGSPAESAGLLAEDIILEINGEPVTEEDQLASLIQRHEVGDTVILKVLRKGEEIELQAVLADRG